VFWVEEEVELEVGGSCLLIFKNAGREVWRKGHFIRWLSEARNGYITFLQRELPYAKICVLPIISLRSAVARLWESVLGTASCAVMSRH